MGFSFASLRYQPVESLLAIVPIIEPTGGIREVVGERLLAEAVIKIWNEQSANHETNNDELIKWWNSQESPRFSLRRYCDLIAAASLSMNLGTYVEPIIRPLIEKH